MLAEGLESARRWLFSEGADHDRPAPPFLTRLGLLWVGVSVVFTSVAAFWADSPGSYVFVRVFLASGAYIVPGLVIGWLRVRRAPDPDRFAYGLLYTGMVAVFAIGVGQLVGLATGWRWGNVLGIPMVVVAGALHLAGPLVLLRRRSGGLRLSIDLVEMAAALVALGAPFVVLAGPVLADAQAAWFAWPGAASVPFGILAGYLGLLLVIRLGPGRGAFEVCVIAWLVTAAGNTVLETVQGSTGFALPAPPLIALHAVCMSMYLLIPLYVPKLIRPGLDALPPQGQVRGARMAAGLVATGVTVLLVATAATAGEHPWAVPFALVAVSLLLLLGLLRQVAAVGETRRLYRQVEAAADERRRLVRQLLERSVHERRHFADQLYEQALAAYTSFRVMAGSQGGSPRSPAVAAEVSARVGGDLARKAEWVRGLVLAIRPLEGEPTARDRLGVPIRAYLADLYGDRAAPRLTIAAPDALVLAWATETVLLQIVQEALDNVHAHSGARTVGVALDADVAADADAVWLRITDDGAGFDPASVPEGSGLATMRASAAVVRGTLTIDSRPGAGTVITARLGLGGPEPPPVPVLRLVPPPSPSAGGR